MKHFFLPLAVLMVACSGHSQGDVDQSSSALAARATEDIETVGFSERIDRLFGEFDTSETPGCAVGVVHEGAFAHAKGYGLANLEHGIHINRKSVFRIGSVSKQFTALAIALLADRGELDLDADIHLYLPELIDFGVPVTVRQMVHHISGMGDYNDTFEVSPGNPFWFGDKDYWTIEEFAEEVAKQPLALEPGTTFQYSNLAYFLLSQVVEGVSGMSLRAFADIEIFRPLGMDNTFFNDDVTDIVPNRADGYQRLEAGDFKIFMTNLDWVGDGGVYTTLDDFIKWDRALATREIPGGPGVHRLITTPHELTVRKSDGDDGDRSGYAFGMVVGTLDGLSVRQHTGAWVGFRSIYTQFPEDGVSIFVFCNRTDGFGNHLRELKNDAINTFGR